MSPANFLVEPPTPSSRSHTLAGPLHYLLALQRCVSLKIHWGSASGKTSRSSFLQKYFVRLKRRQVTGAIPDQEKNMKEKWNQLEHF